MSKPAKSRPRQFIDGEVHFECAKCKEWKPRAGFYRRSGSACGVDSRCRACKRADAAERRPASEPTERNDDGMREFRHAKRYPDLLEARKSRVDAYAAQVQRGMKIHYTRRESA